MASTVVEPGTSGGERSRRGTDAARPRQLAQRSGRATFRPSSRSRTRIAVGALLSLLSIGAILLIFATADKRVPVLQVVHDIPAGSQLAADDVRSIEVTVDPSLQVVRAADLDLVIGRYAKVRMVAGVLLVAPSLQSNPLVGPGSSIVAVTVKAGGLPIGLRERSSVQLVFPASSGVTDAVAPEPVAGRVVGLPSTPDPVTGELSLSVEVPADSAATVAAQPVVRVVLLDPGVDPASQPASGTQPPATSSSELGGGSSS